ncbi:DUF3311 domain-containing protein [Bacillus sp. B190/17]|uniref:DUF3311 domain-containing protein n=1 Tax=Bacillus lumedeiriae TaxID=3058829 RepID=A0ABW8ICU6_9BACI
MKLYHLLVLVPLLGMLGGIGFANRVTPYVFGLPFLHFWLVLWVILTSFVLMIIYRMDEGKRKGDHQ